MRLRNVSDREITSFWMEALIHDPHSKVWSTNSNGSHLRWPAERVLEPNSEVWAREEVLETRVMFLAAKELHTTCVYATALVRRVEFADGTSWPPPSRLEMGFTPMADQRMASRDCSNAPPDEHAWDNFGYAIQNTFPGKLGDFVELEEEKSYSYSCPLKVFADGRHAVMCRF